MADAARVRGGDVVAKNLERFTSGFLKEVTEDMHRVEELLRERIRTNISLSDHTLAELADMGHPYAARAPQHLHDPDYQVHTQGGGLIAGLYSGTSDAGVSSAGTLTARAYAGISEAVGHALFVILGTSKMVPRDFLGGSLEEVRDAALEILRRSLHEAVISFRGETVKL